MCVAGGDVRKARALAEDLGLAFLESPERGLVLAVTSDGLALRDAGRPRAKALATALRGDASTRAPAHGRRSLLGRALGLTRRPNPHVVDATCGLGRDAAAMLTLGCEVTGIERHPVLAAMLADALRRHRPAGWHELVEHDACEWLESRPAPVADVVYLDPMFAEPSRRALPKQPMQWLAALVGKDEDFEPLLAAARAKAPRVVLKRHPRSPSPRPADLRFEGRRARYDVYLNPALAQAAGGRDSG